MSEGAFFVGLSNVLTGALFVLLAIPLLLRKVGPNKVYGVRTAKAFASESNWYAINVVGGRWIAVAGLVLALCGGYVLLRPPATLVGVLVASLAPVPLVLLTLIPVLRFSRHLPG